MTTISDNAADIRQQLGLDVANTPTFAGVNADTINEKTSAAGVTIDGVLIKDNTIKCTNNVSSAALTINALEGFNGAINWQINNTDTWTSQVWADSSNAFRFYFFPSALNAMIIYTDGSLELAGNKIRVRTTKTPAYAMDTGNAGRYAGTRITSMCALPLTHGREQP